MKIDVVIEWMAVGILLVGVTLTSYNIYPLNIWITFFGNILWLILGFMWSKQVLIFLQIVMLILNVLGFIHYYT